jgi:hypothetical protein
MHKRALQILFGFILVSLTTYNLWVSTRQWVLCKETRALPRVLWFLAIMGLGNIAMSAYVLRQLARLGNEDSLGTLLSARNV